ncbi:unnamed protein product [Protopolystoma xenopodis]|uniref:Uncharacterized protein n=1 Tax=Protopolystoma xenopodis TaxID=117903 RepID=A0A448WI60_9PLAT|nr:unnamed protein product [Protopolystoma xenopodis]
MSSSSDDVHHTVDEISARFRLKRGRMSWGLRRRERHIKARRGLLDPRTGATPLHVAASKDYSDVIEALLKVPGVEVDAVDADGWTPLHAAAHWSKENAARLLAGAGASFDRLTLAVGCLFYQTFLINS